MKVQQPVRDFTGMFPPVDGPIVQLLSYEMPNDHPDSVKYAAFTEAVGGFNPWNAELEPMVFDEDERMENYLDSITGAFERGFLSQTEWPTQLFESLEHLQSFINALVEYEPRIRDRHFRALAVLSGNPDAVFTGVVAEELRAKAEVLTLGPSTRL